MNTNEASNYLGICLRASFIATLLAKAIFFVITRRRLKDQISPKIVQNSKSRHHVPDDDRVVPKGSSGTKSGRWNVNQPRSTVLREK